VSLLGLAKAPDGPLDRCFVELDHLAKVLRSSLTSHGENGIRRAGKAMLWPLRQTGINRSLEIIKREMDILNLALTGDTKLVSHCICYPFLLPANSYPIS
jgi:hypothetical protein